MAAAFETEIDHAVVDGEPPGEASRYRYARSTGRRLCEFTIGSGRCAGASRCDGGGLCPGAVRAHLRGLLWLDPVFRQSVLRRSLFRVWRPSLVLSETLPATRLARGAD